MISPPPPYQLLPFLPHHLTSFYHRILISSLQIITLFLIATGTANPAQVRIRQERAGKVVGEGWYELAWWWGVYIIKIVNICKDVIKI